jgi:hypothetical protein
MTAKSKIKRPNQKGCKVKLSSFGIEMQGAAKAKLIGEVVGFLNWCSTPTYLDGLATVKWEGIAKPDTMHVNQIESI